MNRSMLKANAKAQLGGSVFSNIWVMAMVVALIVGLLSGGILGGAASMGGFRFNFSFNNHNVDLGNLPNAFDPETFDPETFFNDFSGFPFAIFAGAFGLVFLIAGVFGTAYTAFIAGPVSMGQKLVHLKLVRGSGTVDLGDLFAAFRQNYLNNVILVFLRGLFVWLWSLLFIIPGIVMNYAYSMAYYVRLDHPDYDWRRCLDESKALTQGHKGELFVLDLSFIGWFFVGSLCCGVGSYWVIAYKETTLANAYDWLCALAYPAPEAPAPEYAAPADPTEENG